MKEGISVLTEWVTIGCGIGIKAFIALFVFALLLFCFGGLLGVFISIAKGVDEDDLDRH